MLSFLDHLTARRVSGVVVSVNNDMICDEANESSLQVGARSSWEEFKAFNKINKCYGNMSLRMN